MSADGNIIAGAVLVLIFVAYRLAAFWRRPRAENYATMSGDAKLPREAQFARFHRDAKSGSDVFHFDVLGRPLESGRSPISGGGRLVMSFPVRAASGDEADALLAAADPRGRIDAPQAWGRGGPIAGVFTFMSGPLPEGIEVLGRETRAGAEVLRVKVPEARLGGMALADPDVYLVRADYGLRGLAGFVVVDRPFAGLKKGVVARVEDARRDGVYGFA